MVIALLGGSDVTLKKFYREHGTHPPAARQPDDAADLRASRADVQVQGVVIGVMRQVLKRTRAMNCRTEADQLHDRAREGTTSPRASTRTSARSRTRRSTSRSTFCEVLPLSERDIQDAEAGPHRARAGARADRRAGAVRPGLIAALQEHMRAYSESYSKCGWAKGPIHEEPRVQLKREPPLIAAPRPALRTSIRRIAVERRVSRFNAGSLSDARFSSGSAGRPLPSGRAARHARTCVQWPSRRRASRRRASRGMRMADGWQTHARLCRGVPGSIERFSETSRPVDERCGARARAGSNGVGRRERGSSLPDATGDARRTAVRPKQSPGGAGRDFGVAGGDRRSERRRRRPRSAARLVSPSGMLHRPARIRGAADSRRSTSRACPADRPGRRGSRAGYLDPRRSRGARR